MEASLSDLGLWRTKWILRAQSGSERGIGGSWRMRDYAVWAWTITSRNDRGCIGTGGSCGARKNGSLGGRWCLGLGGGCAIGQCWLVGDDVVVWGVLCLVQPCRRL